MRRLIDYRIVIVTVAVILGIIFIFVLYRINLPLDYPRRKKKLIDLDGKLEQRFRVMPPEKNNLNSLKTGDLLGVSYQSLRGKLVQIFTGSAWTHLGMVYRDPDDGQIYMIEMARYSRDENGLIMKPLKEWIDWNKKYILSHRPYIGPNPFPEKQLSIFLGKELAKEHRPDLSVISWLKTMTERSYHPPSDDKNSYYCSEFIAHILQSIGILYKEIDPGSYKPWQFIYGDLPVRPGYSYGENCLLSIDLVI